MVWTPMPKPPASTGPPTPFDPERLTRLTPVQLQRLYREVFGCAAPTSNVHHLRRKLAWELQARIEGRLPDAALERALTIARHSVLRSRPVQPNSPADRIQTAAGQQPGQQPAHGDPRLPRPGACLVRTFRERNVVVKVLAAGFEFDGRHFPSLSAIAREVTGTRWNGFVFFGLVKPFRHARHTSR